MRFLNKRSKSNPKATVAALRRAIAGEDIVSDGFKGIDLSKLSVSQLKAIYEIQLKAQDGNLSEDERKEIERILNNGLEPITGFKLVHGNEVTTLAKRPVTWFDKDDEAQEVEGYERPSWFLSDTKPSWFESKQEHSETIPKPEPPKKSIVQRVHDFFTSPNLADSSDSTECSEGSEVSKNELLCRCWCSMLSLYNHKPLHQQPDTVNPHNEPEIANHQFGMGESHS